MKSLKSGKLAQALGWLINTRVWSYLVVTYNVAVAAGKKFLADDCVIRANAISYSIVFSIIPLLSVLVRYADIKKEVIRSNFARFLAAYGLSGNTELLLILDEILARANAIAGLGAIVMIFSATNVISYLEDSFNYIYKASTSRRFHYRFALYISSLVLLPGVLYLISGIFSSFSATVNPPEFNSIAADQHRYWITGSDGILRVHDRGDLFQINLKDRVNPRAEFREIYFDLADGKSGRYDEIMRKDNAGFRLRKTDFQSIHRLAIQGNDIHVLSRTGALFYSKDRGVTWDFNRFGFKSNAGAVSAYMEDIIRLPDGQLLMLANVEGATWLVRKNLKNLWQIHELKSHFHKFAHYNQIRTTPELAGLYLLGNGVYIKSLDGGLTWSKPTDAVLAGRKTRLNVLVTDAMGTMTLAGKSSHIWTKSEAGDRITDIRSNKREIYGLQFDNDDSGLLYGADGLLRFTVDRGKTWLAPEDSSLSSTTFRAHALMPSGQVILVGKYKTILRLRSPALTDKRDAKGFPLVHVEILEEHQYPIMISILFQFFLSFLLFGLVFMVFVLGYRFLPNAVVSWRPAFIGGVITSLALVIFITGFRLWFVSFSSTALIYGVWAFVPVVMILILIANYIVLFGLETAYVIQHPYLYKRVSKIHYNQSEFKLWNAVLLTSLVYHFMYEIKRPLENKDALPYFNNDIGTLETTRELLRRSGLLAYESSSEEYYPVRPPNEIEVREIQTLTFSNILHVPAEESKNAYRARFDRLVSELEGKLNREDTRLTIAELLPLLAGKIR